MLVNNGMLLNKLKQRTIIIPYMIKLINNSLIWIFCLTALILTFCHCDCFISHYPRRTTIGFIHADIDNYYSSQNRPQIYSYPLVQQIQDPLLSRTAIAVSGFKVDRKNNQFGFKIEYSFQKNDGNIVIFTVTMNKGNNNPVNQWVYIKFNFIVTEIPEILGSTRNIQYLMPTQSLQKYRISTKIYYPPNSNFISRPKVKIFISGIYFIQKNTLSAESRSKIQQYMNTIKMLRKYSWNQVLLKRLTRLATTEKDPRISMTEAKLDNQNINFQIKVTQASMKEFSFSYLIYLEKAKDIIYQTIDGSFVTVDQEKSFINGMEHNQMNIFGLNSIRFANQFNGIITLQIQQNLIQSQPFFLSKVQGENAQFNIQYFAIKTLPGAVCLTCPRSPLIYSQFCVSQCPSGHISGFNSDGSLQCIKCDIQNFKIPDEGRRSCVCANGYHLVTPTKTCNRCPYDCLTCNGNKCLTCDSQPQSSFRRLNQQTGRCQCLAMNNIGRGLYDDSTNQQRRCQLCNLRCLTCKGPLTNDCLTCSITRVYMNGVCKCDQNFVQNQRGQCICGFPYTLNQGRRCILTSSRCQQSQILVSNPSGQRSCNCRPGFTRSLFSNKCIRQCQSYQQLNLQTQTCQCRKGFIRNEISSVCYPCTSKLNQFYNQMTNRCQCLPGFEMNRFGECTTCPSRSFYNNKTDRCECVFNYYRTSFNGSCMKCKSQNDNPNCRSLSKITNFDL